ncbi:MAG: 2-hydroxycarboxylate transporter family protein [Sporomusaceae bacterium]|nr:2-hydroxycarboxylate transporter family protein [Sporomusaceae bacterium]
MSEKDVNVFTKYKVGPMPLPIYLVVVAIIFAGAHYGKLPADMIGGIAVMVVMGMLLGDIGLKVPILRDIGGPAILSVFVPSIMVFYKLLDPASLKAITAFMKGSNFLYFYISCLVTGSILGMLRVVLIQGFLKMFVPLLVGTICASLVGVGVGTITGLGAYKALFFVIIPVFAGGVGEGVLPLSVGYAEILNVSNTQLIPQLMPAAMLGNLCAIILAGLLKRLSQKRPEFSGEGMLVKTGNDEFLRKAQSEEKPVDFALMGAGLLLATTFFVFGGLVNKFIDIPGPIVMIFSAAIIKAIGIMPASMEQGAHHLYRFVASSLTWALLVGVGVLYTPWQDVVAAVSPAYVITIVATVITMVSSGFFVGKMMNMYPIETAIVTACHSGLGGTGDVAILSSANRMSLMPFAQVSTRLGGGCTVIGACVLLKMIQ